MGCAPSSASVSTVLICEIHSKKRDDDLSSSRSSRDLQEKSGQLTDRVPDVLHPRRSRNPPVSSLSVPPLGASSVGDGHEHIRESIWPVLDLSRVLMGWRGSGVVGGWGGGGG